MLVGRGRGVLSSFWRELNSEEGISNSSIAQIEVENTRQVEC